MKVNGTTGADVCNKKKEKKRSLPKRVEVVEDKEEGERCSLLRRAQLTADGDRRSAGWCQHTHTHTLTNTHTLTED